MVIRGCWPQASAMDRQTLRDWVHRYNAGWLGRAGGPAPAWASASSGRSPAERSGEVVEDGPDLKTDGVVRWRCADLRDRIAANSMFICMSAASASC